MNATVELTGGALRVRFMRIGDRYAHFIDACDAQGFHPVLESVEGTTTDDAWPPSPPLQDLHIEQRPGGVQVALLVGRAGRSHWSLSIALDASSHTILFDAACRTGERPLWLGSIYSCLSPGLHTLSDCGRGLAMEMLEGIDAALLNEERGTIALPARVAEQSGNQTNRWRYRIQIGKNI